MTDRPMAFSPAMIAALFDGRKTQTRRLAGVPDIIQQPNGLWHIRTKHGGTVSVDEDNIGEVAANCAPTQPGDRLWVREEHYSLGHWEAVPNKLTPGGRQKHRFVPAGGVTFVPLPGASSSRPNVNPELPAWYKRLGRFMFRRDSRLTLHVTEVRVQRLHDITEADCIAEGVIREEPFRYTVPGICTMDSARSAYFTLLDYLHGQGFSVANPWVVAVSFEIEHCNISNARTA